MKTYARVFAAAAALALTAINIAHAQLVVGGQFGIESQYHLNSDAGRSVSSGGFVQWRPGKFGMHVAISRDSGSVEQTSSNSINTRTITFGESMDLLGMVESPGYGGKWIGMFGLTSVDVESTDSSCFFFEQDGRISQTSCGGDYHTDFSVTDSDTAIGWKLAVGVETELSEKWVLQTMVEYAKLGAVKVADSSEFEANRTSDLDNFTTTNISINIGYRF